MATGTISKYADGTDSGFKSITPSSSNVASGTIDYRRIGDIVMIRVSNVKLKAALAANSTRVIGAAPSAITPTSAVRGTGGTNLNPMNLILNPTGNISIGGVAVDTTTALNFNVIYIVG